MYVWFSSLAELKGVDDGGGGSFFGATSGQKFRQHLDLDSFWVDDLQLSGIFDQETVDIRQTIQVWAAARLTSSNPRWDGMWGLGVRDPMGVHLDVHPIVQVYDSVYRYRYRFSRYI